MGPVHSPGTDYRHTGVRSGSAEPLMRSEREGFHMDSTRLTDELILTRTLSGSRRSSGPRATSSPSHHRPFASSTSRPCAGSVRHLSPVLAWHGLHPTHWVSEICRLPANHLCPVQPLHIRRVHTDCRLHQHRLSGRLRIGNAVRARRGAQGPAARTRPGEQRHHLPRHRPRLPELE